MRLRAPRSLQRLPYAAPPRALHFTDAAGAGDQLNPAAPAHSAAKR